MLVAPVTIGKEAMIGAGSVITKDVPEKSLGIERSDQKNIEGYVDRKKKKRLNNPVKRRCLYFLVLQIQC